MLNQLSALHKLARLFVRNAIKRKFNYTNYNTRVWIVFTHNHEKHLEVYQRRIVFILRYFGPSIGTLYNAIQVVPIPSKLGVRYVGVAIPGILPTRVKHFQAFDFKSISYLL